MTFQTDMAVGFADAQATLGNWTVLWGGNTIPVIPGDVTLLFPLEIAGGGFHEGAMFAFTMIDSNLPVASTLANKRHQGSKLTFRAHEYRVVKTVPGATSTHLNVLCEEV